jgi:hypothetical protein
MSSFESIFHRLPGWHRSPNRALDGISVHVAGLTGAEITRLRNAVARLSTDWLPATFDGEELHLVLDIPVRGKRNA